MKNLGLIFLLLNSLTTFSQSDLDSQVDELVMVNALKPLEKVQPSSRELTRLGAMLFHEVQLSGNKNIGCNSCHHPRFGTADAMPFSIGTGGVGMGGMRRQRVGGITKRHSPHLLNLGYPEIEFMFWDGRVHFDNKTGIFTTPEPGLNGANPQYKEITQVMTSALSAQTIFPIVNDLEMRGTNNDIANTSTNYDSWNAVMKRLLEGSSGEAYKKQFELAYPGTTQFNIGHVGEALGKFIALSFNIIDTPYDRYLKGDKTAMTESEKRGFVVFATRGKCIKCHNGEHLSNFEFKTVATPQLTPESYPAPYDQGRFEVTGDKSDLFKFKTPTLRHLALTAPYMHNGAFKTLEEVIEHYSNPQQSLADYDLSKADLTPYGDNFVIDRDEKRNKLRVNLISIGEVRRGIQFTDAEKEDLLNFLETGLLDYRFQPNR